MRRSGNHPRTDYYAGAATKFQAGATLRVDDATGAQRPTKSPLRAKTSGQACGYEQVRFCELDHGFGSAAASVIANPAAKDGRVIALVKTVLLAIQGCGLPRPVAHQGPDFSRHGGHNPNAHQAGTFWAEIATGGAGA
jgi:hypothetical protein